jgi:hypothetical protein
VDRARLEALLQADLDGDLSAAERAELARELLQDGEARSLRDAFVRTERLLRDVPAAEPPPGLRDAILAGAARLPRPRVSAGGRPGRSAYRIAAAVLAGLMIVGLAYMTGPGREPRTELQGSLGAAAGTISLRSGGCAVEATLSRDGERHRLAIRASAIRPCELAVTFDPASTSFAGSDDGIAATAADGQVSMRLPSGDRVTLLEFAGAAPAALELRADGRAVDHADLPVRAP